MPSSARLNEAISSRRSASSASAPGAPTASNDFSVGPYQRRKCSIQASGVRARNVYERRFYTFRAPTPEAWIDHFRRWYGPTLKSFETVGASGAEALEADLLELIASFNRADDGSMVVPSEYLEAVFVKA